MSLNQSHSLKIPQFWKTFGQYMAPVPSSTGEKINWINYKTSVRFIRFIMKQQDGAIIIAIELSNPDIIVQEKDFEQLLELKTQFSQVCGNDWIWTKFINETQGKYISDISSILINATINKEEDWPKIISFLKPRLVALDVFWNTYQYVFQF